MRQDKERHRKHHKTRHHRRMLAPVSRAWSLQAATPTDINPCPHQVRLETAGRRARNTRVLSSSSTRARCGTLVDQGPAVRYTSWSRRSAYPLRPRNHHPAKDKAVAGQDRQPTSFAHGGSSCERNHFGGGDTWRGEGVDTGQVPRFWSILAFEAGQCGATVRAHQDSTWDSEHCLETRAWDEKKGTMCYKHPV